jgi:septum formation protein
MAGPLTGSKFVHDPSTPTLVLASQSPRRAQLLTMLGLQFEINPADLDEAYQDGENPVDHAGRLALDKARAVASTRPDAVVVGSDTVVIIDGHLLGKPATAEQAVSMLMRLQGRMHTVATGIAVVAGEREAIGVEQVNVRFRSFDRSTAEEYVATGEPMDKAGAYGIQGFGATLVESIDGDYFAVMGLPVCRMIGLLENLGWHYAFPGLRRI